MLTPNRIPTHLLACLAAGWFCLMTCHTATWAGHCGCEPSCEMSPPPVACDCHCSHARKPNCLKTAWDRLASGIDKLFSLGDRGCDELLCDDACDAAMIDELMVPIAPPAIHHHPHQDHPSSPHHHPHAAESAGEAIEVPAEEHEGEMPPPVRLKEPPSEPEGGSLFDIRDDPFDDDDARLRTYRPIRPSAYEQVELRPIRSSQRSRSSARPVRSSR